MRFPLVAFVALVIPVSLAIAERVPLSPEQLKAESTHVLTGKLIAIYSKDVETRLYGPGTIETRYILEIEIDGVEKGDGVKPKDIIYARCWQLKKPGAAGLVPGPGGHHIPEKSSRLRVFVARGKYPPGGQNDNGFAVDYPNGIEILPKPAGK